LNNTALLQRIQGEEKMKRSPEDIMAFIAIAFVVIVILAAVVNHFLLSTKL